MSEYTFPLALKDTGALLLRLPSVWGVWGRKRLDPHLREEVMVAVAAAIGCRYCTFSHREIVLQSGESLMALAEFEQVEEPDERVFTAIIWAQAKVEADFGAAPLAIERELKTRFTDRECRDLETVAIAMKLMSSCGHEADGLVQRLSGKPGPHDNLGNQILMALLYFPPAILVYLLLASKRGSVRSLVSDFRSFSARFETGVARGSHPEPKPEPRPAASVG